MSVWKLFEKEYFITELFYLNLKLLFLQVEFLSFFEYVIKLYLKEVLFWYENVTEVSRMFQQYLSFEELLLLW